ncbi:hypothetical protein C9374_011641 [Naegleria lovaniensis]|uniref:Uncharacterized protein n=1 Tax=Naegleria lovaniensis TaxID=51637 RepID=A0AA88GCI1_NAELO|nr:uncharacterized protein C9374_011641 [Naegleria lovaniensis]KAG2373976.1 hypothetical protein C9374_011641 [Naegleria lovaniensis]
MEIAPHALLVDDTIYHTLQFLDSEFIVRVCTLVSKQWFSKSLQIALKFDFSEPIPLKIPLPILPSLEEFVFLDRVRSKMNIQKLAQWVSCTTTYNLTELNLSRHFLNDDGAKLIACSELMNNLKTLNLSRNNLSSAGAQYIATSRHMANLRVLILKRNSVCNEGYFSIAKSKYMKNLTWLDLFKNEHVDNEAVKAIANSEYMSNLTYLRLEASDNLEDEVSIVKSHVMRNLTSLKMFCSDSGETAALFSCPEFQCTNLKVFATNIDQRGAKAIATSKRSENLTTLHVNVFDDSLDACVKLIVSSQYMQNLQRLIVMNFSRTTWIDSAELMTSNTNMKNLTSLELTEVGMNDQEASIFGKSELLKNLRELILKSNDIQADGIQHIVNNPYISQLRVLDLFDNSINDEGARQISNSKYLQNLTTLNIGVNDITHEGAHNVASSEYLKNLTSLSMSDDIKDQAVKSIADSEFMANLTSLSLSFCLITDEGAKILASSPFMSNLTSLELTDNLIGYAGASSLATSMYLTNLKVIDLNGDNITMDGILQELLFAGIPPLVIQKENEQLSTKQQQVVDKCLDEMILLLKQHPHTKQAETLNFCLRGIIDQFGLLVIRSRMEEIIDMLFKVVRENVDPTKEETTTHANSTLQQEIESNRCIYAYLDNIDSMVCVLRKQFTPYLDLIWQDILKYLQIPNNQPEEEITSALCFICSSIEAVEELPTAYCSQLIPILMQYMTHTTVGAQRNAVYGIGILAFYNPQEVKPHITKIMNILSIVLDTFGLDANVLDNACATFSRLVIAEIVDFQLILDLFPRFVKALPLRSDLKEFDICYSGLSKMMDMFVLEHWNSASLIFSKLVQGLTLPAVNEDSKKLIVKNIQHFKEKHPVSFEKMIFDSNGCLLEEMKILMEFMKQ